MTATNMTAPKNVFSVFGKQVEGQFYHNLSPAELVEHALQNGEGVLADTGALMIDTGKFTGRSPEDKFFVRDETTEKEVWWGDANKGISTQSFNGIKSKMIEACVGKKLYVKDVKVCADGRYAANVRVFSEFAYSSLFVDNMFICLSNEEAQAFSPDYTILCLPSFQADPATDGTRQGNFTIVNMTEKAIIIGGSGYTGEIKKSVFSAVNFSLPVFDNVFPMHCSANESKYNGDTAVFFGLSGTGKTTLSADEHRNLIGDDEHGWSEEGIFNFEGGCYAKTINITKESEPEIFQAIKFGALLENTRFYPGTRNVDYTNKSVTENTRVSYPLEHIPGAKIPSIGKAPNHIFFLTCDANGILPPVSRLEKSQAMFHFISGYTAKVAGTEMNITEPKLTFSTCFGAPFMALHPARYAELLGKKMDQTGAKVWLINTGWVGGGYGVGSRIKLRYTRAMINAILSGALEKVEFLPEHTFGVKIPTSCPEVPAEILNPRNSWANKDDYDTRREYLAGQFLKNFEKFRDFATQEMINGAPKLSVSL